MAIPREIQEILGRALAGVEIPGGRGDANSFPKRTPTIAEQLAALQRIAANKDRVFRPGDVITPIEGGGIAGRGIPHLVIDFLGSNMSSEIVAREMETQATKLAPVLWFKGIGRNLVSVLTLVQNGKSSPMYGLYYIDCMLMEPWEEGRDYGG